MSKRRILGFTPRRGLARGVTIVTTDFRILYDTASASSVELERDPRARVSQTSIPHHRVGSSLTSAKVYSDSRRSAVPEVRPAAVPQAIS